MRYSRESGRWVLGATAEGIDTTGRAAVGNQAEGRVGQCKAWLLGYLKTYAYPASEVEAAAKKAGFNPATVKNAKCDLGREGTGQIRFKKFTDGWWVGLDGAGEWRCRPPTEVKPETVIPD
jgi:hypothetical protein